MEFFTASLVSLTTIFLGILFYFKKAFSYWEKRKVPFENPVIPFGTFLNVLIQKEGFGEGIKTHYETAKKLGHKQFGLFVFSKPCYLPLDPLINRHILGVGFNHFVDRGVYYNKRDDPISAHLFSIEGEDWRRLREKLTPTFTSGKMKMMFHTLVQCGDQMKNFVSQKILRDEPLDIRDILSCFTTDVIGSCAFGLNCDCFNNPDCDFRKYGKQVFDASIWKAITGLFSFFSPDVARRLGIRQNDKELADFFIGTIKETIAYREKNNVIRNDFLQMLINLRNNQVSGQTCLSLEDIAAQAFVFFVAGYETSSTTMMYSLYELSLNQNIQDRAREEVNSIFERYDGRLTYEALSELKYLEQIIDEALRKYPPVPVINRKCVQDYKLPENYGTIEKGTIVFISSYGLHRDSEYFPEPEKFDPDRFTKENKSGIDPYTYLPFGEGPRNCIGLRFGIMQTKVGLAVLLQNFKFHCSEKTKNPLEFDPRSFILAPKGSIWLNASKIE